jgi:hypothetical protein
VNSKTISSIVCVYSTVKSVSLSTSEALIPMHALLRVSRTVESEREKDKTLPQRAPCFRGYEETRLAWGYGFVTCSNSLSPLRL